MVEVVFLRMSLLATELHAPNVQASHSGLWKIHQRLNCDLRQDQVESSLDPAARRVATHYVTKRESAAAEAHSLMCLAVKEGR